MQDINKLFDRFLGVIEASPSPQIPPEVTTFIALISQAKYSTFLTEEKEAQYHQLDIARIINISRDFENSCKASVLFNPVVLNYIKSVRTQVQEDFI